MHIYGPSQLHGPQGINAPHGARPAQPTARPEAPQIADEVNISEAAQLVEQVQQLPDIRADRVAAVRQQIAAGTYETGDKLSAAVERPARRDRVALSQLALETVRARARRVCPEVQQYSAVRLLQFVPYGEIELDRSDGGVVRGPRVFGVGTVLRQISANCSTDSASEAIPSSFASH